uniref:Putative polyglutamine binding protein 1 n=1 Tax=Ixodes ricinus TaxID=34613 RepID=A0A0K8RN28_IXORI
MRRMKRRRRGRHAVRHPANRLPHGGSTVAFRNGVGKSCSLRTTWTRWTLQLIRTYHGASGPRGWRRATKPRREQTPRPAGRCTRCGRTRVLGQCCDSMRQGVVLRRTTKTKTECNTVGDNKM